MLSVSVVDGKISEITEREYGEWIGSKVFEFELMIGSEGYRLLATVSCRDAEFRPTGTEIRTYTKKETE